MSINLTKGQKINLGRTNIKVGLCWTRNQDSNQKFDLDCSVFLLDANKMIPTEEFFVFYNNRQCPQQAVIHSGDSRDGSTSSTGDDETISVDTSKLDSRITELIFVVTIDDADLKNQNFGMVRNSYVRFVDNNTNEEVARYNLDENFSVETSIEFCRLFKIDNEWKFEATPIGHKSDLATFVSKYYQGPVSK